MYGDSVSVRTLNGGIRKQKDHLLVLKGRLVVEA